MRRTYELFRFNSKPRAKRSDFTRWAVWIGGGIGFYGIGILFDKKPTTYTENCYILEIGLVLIKAYVIYEV